MPRGAYTAKQDRKADHIEESYEKRGVSKKEAESRAWATVNKQDKGGKNDGSRPLPQPQRRRQEGLGNPAQALEIGLKARSRISSARSIARSSLCARRSSLSARPEPARGWLASSLAARLGQPQREPAAIVGIGLALDQAGADQGIDRAADRRRAAPDRRGDLVEGRRLVASRSPTSSLRRARSARSAGPSATQFCATAAKRAASAAGVDPPNMIAA